MHRRKRPTTRTAHAWRPWCADTSSARPTAQPRRLKPAAAHSRTCPCAATWCYTVRMSALGPEFAAIASLLPEEHVGTVAAIATISTGASGAAVYAVTTTRGD